MTGNDKHKQKPSRQEVIGTLLTEADKQITLEKVKKGQPAGNKKPAEQGGQSLQPN